MTEKSSPNRLVVACPECGKKLGFPGDRGTLRVTCPACQHAFDWRPENEAPLDAIAAEAAPGVYPSESDYLRFAARLVTGTLLGEIKRADGPGGAPQGSIDPERVAGTSLLAGRKVFGEGYTRALVEEAARWGAGDVRNCLDRLTGEALFARMKAACSGGQKDNLILAALTALELNIDDIGVELLKLRAFGHRFYDTPVECDQRMIMHGGTATALYPRAIELVNEIVRELNGDAASASASAPAPGAAAPAKPQRPVRQIGLGLFVLVACACIAMGAIAFGARNIEDPPAWLALGGAALSIAFYFGVYRGFRLLTGAGRWTSVALTVFGFPVLFGGLLFLIGEFVPLNEGRETTLAERSPGGAAGNFEAPGAPATEEEDDIGGDDGPQDIENGEYFSGLNANNTRAADLDELVEYW